MYALSRNGRFVKARYEVAEAALVDRDERRDFERVAEEADFAFRAAFCARVRTIVYLSNGPHSFWSRQTILGSKSFEAIHDALMST